MIAKQGYGKVESKGAFAKWKRRWIILMNSKAITEKEVLIFKTEKSAKDNDNCKKIALENIENIYVKDMSGEKQIIELAFKDGAIKRLLFTLESVAKEWLEQFNLVCFDSVLGKAFKEAVNDDVGHIVKCLTPTNEEALESTTGQSSHEFFPAYLQPSAKLNISGDCSLKVTPENIMVFDTKSPNIMLVSWPIRALRRFGFDTARFTFEAGRRCDTGEGIFVFKTSHGEEIHKIVQTRAQYLAHDATSLPTADDNDNDNFGFRPLPPLPND